ncbi:HAD-like domain-containing protein, partial [Zychaea mexicana]|uniref:HAD-like domain-containing protein n=1 Tax=Zychaea mexicana TaxID=64656 RepID=UPI0022FE2BBB
RLEQENAERLLHDRKLSLILDLDQTVVHATWDPTVGDWMKDENNTNHPATKDIRKFTLPGSSLMYYIKLRPGLSEFLRQVSGLYELHIYTMGTRHYAEAVAREIDPEDKLFRGRILSRDESGSVTQKKIQRLFPCDTSMVVVLDDRSDVWSFSPNLIKIKPYEFFVGIGDINSPFAPKQILAEQEKIQEAMAKEQQQQRPLAQKQNELAPGQDRPLLVDDDKELYTMSTILTEVHERFYKGLDVYDKHKKDDENGAKSSVGKPDVKDLIPEMKRKILDGVHIVFSGLIPQQQVLSDSMYWRLAESFGAVCLPDLTGNVTHVIAAKAGTDKVNRARRANKIFIVTVDWLLDSTARWDKQDEKRYILPSLNPSASVGSDAGEVEVENPESTPFDDGAFDPDEHSLGEDVDWDDMDREVDDALNESGTDFGDTDSEALDR